MQPAPAADEMWPDLLSGHNRIATTDPDLFLEAVPRIFGVTFVGLHRPEHFSGSACFALLPRSALALVECSVGGLARNPASDYLRLQLPLRGRAVAQIRGAEVLLGDGRGCIAPAEAFEEQGLPELQQRLTLRLSQAALQERLAQLLGSRPRRPLQFAPALDLTSDRLQSLMRLLRAIAGELHPPRMTPPAVLTELEDAAILSLLLSTEHSYADVLLEQPRDTSAQHVRLVEEFIAAHWDRPLAMADLVAQSGVSERTLFASFRKQRGVTPMAFLKAERLRHARALLAGGEPGTTVTAVAYRCGFQNHGHFARDYRLAFGERPSETLSRASLPRVGR
jgi:AraC-like DNA-binding protein